MIERSDEEIMAAVARGDSGALGTLYDRYGPGVYSLSLRILSDRQLAEELVQETFLRVWRAASSYQSVRGSIASWIMGIARNLAIDELRRRGARPRAATRAADDSLTGLESGEEDPAEQVYARIRHEAVAGALDQLPVAQRDVLELAYFGGLSQSEIAERLGEPLGTVKTRMRLGLQKLKGILGPTAVEWETR